MSHPLKSIERQIRAQNLYTVRDLAGLLGVSIQSVRSVHAGGYLPGAAWESIPGGRGGGRYVWRGEQLLAALDLTLDDLPALDHQRYAPATLWRLGCGCEDCSAWHNASTKADRRQQAGERFPPDRREQLLALVAAGTVVKEAAEAVGVRTGQVYGACTTDPEFSRRLDEAGEALCVAASDPQCGSHALYRRRGCRGTACRKAHNLQTRPQTAAQ